MTENVWSVHLSHRHGEEFHLFRAEASAKKYVVDWAREWWPTECGPDGQMSQADFDALDDDTAIATYFDRMNEIGEEFYNIALQAIED